jgi:hypothetical protein
MAFSSPTKPPAVPLPRSRISAATAGTPPEQVRISVRKIGPSQAKDCPQVIAHLGSGFWIRHLGRMREARSLAKQQTYETFGSHNRFQLRRGIVGVRAAL